MRLLVVAVGFERRVYDAAVLVALADAVGVERGDVSLWHVVEPAEVRSFATLRELAADLDRDPPLREPLNTLVSAVERDGERRALTAEERAAAGEHALATLKPAASFTAYDSLEPDGSVEWSVRPAGSIASARLRLRLNRG